MFRGVLVLGLCGAILGLGAGCRHLSPEVLKSEGVYFGGDPAPIAVDASLFEDALGAASPFQTILRQVATAARIGRAGESINHVGFLEGGEDALLARLHLIQQAKRNIDIQTFIWAGDESGRLLARALMDAARRSVKVRVLVDYVGIEKDAAALALVERAHPNLEVRVYRPTARSLEGGYAESLLYALTNFKGANQRMHNKVLVADETVAITGGRNVENSYFDHALGMNFKDRDALVVGPVATEMARSFSSFWDYRHTLPVEALRDVARAAADPDPELKSMAAEVTPVSRRLDEIASQAGDPALIERRLVRLMRPAGTVSFVSDLPGKNGALHLNGGGKATAHVIGALERARKEIWIQSPYLVLERPGRGFFKRLRKARPDLKIGVSTNSFGSTDNLVAYAGNVRSRDRYVHQLGFEISEYRPWPGDLRRALPTYDWLVREWSKQGSQSKRPPSLCIHAKSFVVDDDLAFVGSFNLDPRSAHLNTECGVLIRDRALAAELRKEIQRDLEAENGWIIAPRPGGETLVGLQMLSREITDLSPVDMTILDATTAYELRPGARPVPAGHSEFYRNYRDVGSFPGGKGILTKREVKGRLLKLSTPAIDPLL